MKEFAKGIPKKGVKASIPTITKTQQWDFVVQKHNAIKRKLHYDLRLAPPNEVGFSWVLNSLPSSGSRVDAIRTFDHNPKYFDFKGKISSGYGAGTVDIVYRGKVDVLHSSPNKITFYFYGNTGTTLTKYTLIAPYGGDKWLLLNHTDTIKLKKIREEKFDPYKDLSGKYTPEKGDFHTPKIDGASSLVILLGKKTPVVYGKRISKRTGTAIEYTQKIPNLLNMKVPESFGTTVLRAEIFAVDKNNKEIPNSTLGGLLNSSVQKSRATQKIANIPLRLAAFNVLKYKGKNLKNVSIEERYKIIKEINKKFPIIENPLMLKKKIKFKEGEVIWRGNLPMKVKNKKDYDVYVKNIFATKSADRAGGIEYSLAPNKQTVGRVGTGWDHKELKDMLENKSKYIGRVAKVFAQEQYPSGALRSPSFNSWHLDKEASRKIIPAIYKALKETVIGSSKITNEAGEFYNKKNKTFKAYQSFAKKIGENNVHRMRLKSKASIVENLRKNKELVDLVGVQLTPSKTLKDVENNIKRMEDVGAKIIRNKKIIKPGYVGSNTVIKYHGKIMEVQQTPSRMANFGQIIQHNALPKAENIKNFSELDRKFMDTVGKYFINKGSTKWKS